jgi:hypothetical protein
MPLSLRSRLTRTVPKPEQITRLGRQTNYCGPLMPETRSQRPTIIRKLVPAWYFMIICPYLKSRVPAPCVPAERVLMRSLSRPATAQLTSAVLLQPNLYSTGQRNPPARIRRVLSSSPPGPHAAVAASNSFVLTNTQSSGDWAHVTQILRLSPGQAANDDRPVRRPSPEMITTSQRSSQARAVSTGIWAAMSRTHGIRLNWQKVTYTISRLTRHHSIAQNPTTSR